MYQQIVVGTDGSEHAAVAVEHAASLAEAFGAALHVVQGCGTAVVVAPMYSATALVDTSEVIEACTAELRPVADGLSARGIDVTMHISPTSGRDALCAVAEQVNADLIVVGSRGMTGARRMLGSVPNSVAHHAPCSVLIVSTV